MKWHIVTQEHFTTLFDYFDYTHSTENGYTDFYQLILPNGEVLHGKVHECSRTHKNMYFIKY